MKTIFIFLWVYAAMTAMAIWESSAEGRHPWASGKKGWKVKLTNHICVPEYHFFLYGVMLPMLFLLPLLIYGWDSRIFGILLSAYISGTIVEDFMWYVTNPVVKLGEWHSKFSDYYPWIKIGRKKIIPWSYVAGVLISVASWYYLWR